MPRNVELQFSWRMLCPNFVSPIDMIDQEIAAKLEKVYFYPDYSTSFEVKPSCGVLAPKEKRKFDLFYTPHEVGYID